MAWQRQQREERRQRGECVQCGAVVEENPRTGQPFCRCEKHRKLATRDTLTHRAKVTRNNFVRLSIFIATANE